MRGHHALDAVAGWRLLPGSLRQTDHHRRVACPAAAPSLATTRVATSTVIATSSPAAAASTSDATALVAALVAVSTAPVATFVAAAVATTSAWLHLEPRSQLQVACRHGLRWLHHWRLRAP